MQSFQCNQPIDNSSIIKPVMRQGVSEGPGRGFPEIITLPGGNVGIATVVGLLLFISGAGC
jgi:hypothetical protein